MKEVVGFIGLGSMGGPIASRLLDTGHSLVIYDTRAEALERFAGRSVTVADSPRQVANLARIVLVSLPTPDVVRKVATEPGGLCDGEKIEIYVDLSTTGPKTSEEVAERLTRAGVGVVDAPVTGGVAGAAIGKLVLMASGAGETVAQVAPLLENLGQVEVVGDKPGMGQSLKLINNVLSATHMAITAEAMVLGVKAGLDPDTMLKVLNKGSGRNTSTEERFPKFVLTRSFDNGFANALMRKDVKLCMEMAEALQVPLWVATAVDRLWMQTVLQIGPNENTTTIVKTIEQWAGVEVRGKAAPAR
ncbi:NAD(P)-dependent oxidoreductase [Paraburkholderia gardini]|uniref:NAD(P)-dependent oxidoreductase n=1 Tax=Paraburkholderia gardini TaxID=2823469 RepID=UPI001D4131EA|nr:NAD(P)-dependent oxidoreductase [Paraburkholderia gardini]CAG4899968.1 2-(hydroxymethyl)glutarate dehydrogenase [Paraburkholderia gardini]